MSTSDPVRRRRRHHTSEFKQGLVALCQPGVSVSSVAIAHGINTNLLRHWIGLYRNELPAPVSSDYSKLVAVQVDPAPAMSRDDAIEISIEKNRARVSIRWPGHQAQAFGSWLDAWLK